MYISPECKIGYIFYIHVLKDPFLIIFFLGGGGVEGRWVDESMIGTSSMIDAFFVKQINYPLHAYLEIFRRCHNSSSKNVLRKIMF